jgi:hypothetical protein
MRIRSGLLAFVVCAAIVLLSSPAYAGAILFTDRAEFKLR